MDDRELEERFTTLEQYANDQLAVLVKLLEIQGYEVTKEGKIEKKKQK